MSYVEILSTMSLVPSNGNIDSPAGGNIVTTDVYQIEASTKRQVCAKECRHVTKMQA